MAVSPADIGKAAEALNRHKGLSPAARRVGVEIINHVDRKTGLAWPSVARLAEALGYDERTIRRAFADLRDARLLTWKHRGRRTPLYALAWGRLKLLASAIKTRIRAAAQAATGACSTPPASPPPNKITSENRPQARVERTFSPGYFSQYLNRSSEKGFWKAPGAPQNQILTDQQLDARASARFWSALQQLGQDLMAQLIAHPMADDLQAQAIRAERFKAPNTPNGITGLTTLKSLLEREAMART